MFIRLHRIGKTLLQLCGGGICTTVFGQETPCNGRQYHCGNDKVCRTCHDIGGIEHGERIAVDAKAAADSAHIDKPAYKQADQRAVDDFGFAAKGIAEQIMSADADCDNTQADEDK